MYKVDSTKCLQLTVTSSISTDPFDLTILKVVLIRFGETENITGILLVPFLKFLLVIVQGLNTDYKTTLCGPLYYPLVFIYLHNSTCKEAMVKLVTIVWKNFILFVIYCVHTYIFTID